MTEVFMAKDVPYNLRDNSSLALPRAKTSLYGVDTNRFIGKKLRQTLPIEIRDSLSLKTFKQKIK